jgi:hypothetical protein
MKRRMIGLATLCAALGVLAMSVGPASAAERSNIYNFGFDGTLNSTFPADATALAFDETNNRLYTQYFGVGLIGWTVNAPGSYTPLGAPWPLGPAPGAVAQTQGVAVDNRPGPNQGRFYKVATVGPFNAYNPDGSEVGAPFPYGVGTPRSPCGVAVRSNGEVWWANGIAAPVNEGKGIRRYDAAGNELAPLDTRTTVVNAANGTPFFPCRIAFDASDNLYVAASTATGPVFKVTAASNYTSSTVFDPAAANGVAVNKTTGHVFIAHPERVTEFDASGEIVGEFGNEFGVSATKRYLGVAVDEATNEVYVLDSNTNAAQRRVKVFGPPVARTPEAVTKPVTALGRKEATVNAEIDPAGGGGITECRFQWGTSAATYANTANCVPAASVGTPIVAPTAVSAVLPPASLQQGTTYHYRILVKNSGGTTTVGANRTFTTTTAVKETVTGAATNITPNSVTLNGSFNADGVNTTYYFEYGPTNTYGTKFPLPSPPGAAGGNAVGSVPVFQNITGLEPSSSPTGKTYNYRIVAVNSFGTTNGDNKTFNTLPAVKGLVTEPATEVKASSVRMHGTFDPNGIATKYYFEYGPTVAYGSYAPVPPPGEEGGATVGPKAVNALVTGLEAGVTYHFRLTATNVFGTTQGLDQVVVPNDQPTISGDIATEINTDGALLRANINPNALSTDYHFEYGDEDCSITVCESGPVVNIGAGKVAVPVQLVVDGLVPGSAHHFRVVATNARGTTEAVDHTFKAFPLESGVDNCPNVLVRKQTGAGIAPRCRAYELVSAADSGGYDIESNLVAGQHPLGGYPRADGKVAYTVRYGAIPGSGNPTNRGGDPYIASRGESGWTTEYVGFQADGTPSLLPFSSTLAGADDALTTFAFSGPEICDPCFSDGSQNIPLRMPDESLIKGIAGSEGAGPLNTAGTIAKRLSADGSHFVFGTTTKLEPAGNSGSLSIYDRNLDASTTQVVSTLPNGTTMPGAGVEQLDISENGSRILIGRLVGTDPAGNKSYDLYMHVGTDPKSVLIADTTNGVLYSGMNSDGTKVFFTSADSLADDADAGADLYRADVTPTVATVARVSTGTEGTGNLNSCDPVANADGNNWNAVGVASTDGCGVVAIAGGGGVASGDGTVYFLSPEKLDGAANGTLNAPNLYVAEPGSSPEFVTTLDSDNSLILHGVSDAGQRDTADLQVTPDGQFGVFATKLPLTGAEVNGHVEIYRYGVAGGGLACASCTPTNGAPSTDTGLTSNALNIADDGRVFFTSSEPLVLRDTNHLKDVYEWDGTDVWLISTGLDTNDSGLLTGTANGRDVYFFTRESLADQDLNGGAMKIYDAREGGGFLYNPPPRECVASDECHGPSSAVPPPPPINTYEGTEEPQPPIRASSNGKKGCKKGFVKKRGRCVKRSKSKQNRTRRASR